jgi:hypothetical protein
MDAARQAMQAARTRQASGQAGRPQLEPALGGLWDELRGLLHDHLLLVSLESRLALAGLMRMLILAVGCAALLLGAWAVAMTAVLMWLVQTGLSVALALLIVIGATLLLAGGLFWFARRSTREIAFPATLRRLANAPLPESEE